MTSLSPALLESHLLYLTRRLLKGQSKCVLSKLIANTTGSVLCQFHVDQTLYVTYMSPPSQSKSSLREFTAHDITSHAVIIFIYLVKSKGFNEHNSE